MYIPYISLKQTTKLDLKNFIIDGELKLEEIPDSYKIMALGLIICRRSAKISADFKIEEYEYSNLGGAVLRDLANILLQEVKVYRDILKDILEGIDLGDLTKSPLLRILELEEKNNNNLWFSTSLSSAINEIKNGKFEFSFKMKKIKSQSNDSESV